MNLSKVSIRVDGNAVLHQVFGPSLPSSSKKSRNKHRISRCVKGSNSKDVRQGETSSNFPIPGSIEQTFIDAVGISSARSYTVRNMQDDAALPTNESKNHTEEHEESLWNKVQYLDRKLNTQDEKIDELTTDVMNQEEKEHIFLDMEEKSLLLASKDEESAAAALAKLDDVKGRFLASLVKKSDHLRKVQDRAKKQAEASRKLEVIEKAEREAAVVKIIDEHKKVMKRITEKHYWYMRDCLKKGTDIACVYEKELRRLNDHHKKVLETVSGSHDFDMRTKKITISCIKNK